MSLESVIIWLIVGGVAGLLAGLIVKGFGFGLVGNIVVGIVGAFLAGWLLPQTGVSFTLVSPLITSIAYAGRDRRRACASSRARSRFLSGRSSELLGAARDERNASRCAATPAQARASQASAFTAAHPV